MFRSRLYILRKQEILPGALWNLKVLKYVYSAIQAKINDVFFIGKVSHQIPFHSQRVAWQAGISRAKERGSDLSHRGARTLLDLMDTLAASSPGNISLPEVSGEINTHEWKEKSYVSGLDSFYIRALSKCFRSHRCNF